MRSLMAALLIGGAAASLRAQAVTIDPGMTREQVVAKLGEPLSSRSYDGHTYLLYKNGCEKTCGMNDLVTLDSGKVVDAVFRASSRKYSGTSSSPRMISDAEAKRGTGAGGAPLAMPSGAPKPPAKAATKAAAPKTIPPVTKAVTPPTKTPATKTAPVVAPQKSPPPPVVKKAEAAPSKTAAPPPLPKKADAVQSNKAPSIPPPKTNTTAPAKKVEPPPPAKKADSTKKTPTKPPA